MRVTLNINDTIINEVMKETGVKNKTAIINLSLNEYLKKIRRDNLKKLRGKLNLDININELREMDLLK